MALPKSTPKSKRIAAFDVLRGFFLIAILINHIELYPSGFDLFTGRGRLMVSAAEGFFFMSGLLVGLVYKKRIASGMRFIFQKMWARALQLYVLSVLLTVLFTAGAFYLTHSFIKDGVFQTHNWHSIIWQSVQLRYSFGWADFLARFAKLMVIAPVAFYLLVRNKWRILVAASFSVWLFRGESFTAAWQTIFTGGMIIGFYWQNLVSRWQSLKVSTQRQLKRTTVSLAVVSFVFSWAGVFILSLLNQRQASLPGWLQGFTYHWDSFHNYVWVYAQKWTMGPLRIFLFLVWFWALFIFVTRYQGVVRRYTRGYLELLGRNSLFVYIAHAFIVFAFKLLLPTSTSLWSNFLITAAALTALVVVTNLYSNFMAWRAQQGQSPKEQQHKRSLRPEIAEF